MHNEHENYFNKLAIINYYNNELTPDELQEIIIDTYNEYGLLTTIDTTILKGLSSNLYKKWCPILIKLSLDENMIIKLPKGRIEKELITIAKKYNINRRIIRVRRPRYQHIMPSNNYTFITMRINIDS
jgi:hypothetical protein